MLILVRRDTPLCGDFETFTRGSDNNAELFLMLVYSAGQIKEVPTSIIATVNENVIFNGIDLNFEDIMFCYQDEADTRLILHVHDRCRKSYRKLAIVGSDMNIVIVAFFTFMILMLMNLRLNTTLATNGYKYINMQSV